ncbi:MAG: mechanosensitive ion channel [Kofleriaceae bacterium]|nr:mechanosensitive ion channel [Kofleriaceae bacterium]
MKFAFSADYLDYIANAHIYPFGVRILLAVAVFIIGKMVANMIVKAVSSFTEGKLDDSLRRFLCSLLKGILLAVVVIAALEQLGVQTTAAVAILGAAGLAIGFALQGTLGNFAAGVMLILFRPYKIGDVINAAGFIGKVTGIEVFNTVLLTPDNRKIIVPNGQIAGGAIENLSAMETRRIDMVFGVGYDDDIKKTKEILEELIAADERILKDPAAVVALGELADSSVNFIVRPWVKAADYWAVKWDFNEAVKLRFDKEGISIPYPQTDVHLHKVAA